MQSKEKNGNSICHKIKIKEIQPIAAKTLVYVTGKSESLVKKVNNGFRNGETKGGKKIIKASQLLETAFCNAIECVRLEMEKYEEQ